MGVNVVVAVRMPVVMGGTMGVVVMMGVGGCGNHAGTL